MTAEAHRIPDHELTRLRAANPLPALIGREVRLQRSGRGFRGLCPFHGERNPSFFVYPDHFHCFSCGVHGDAVGWIMQRDHVGFREAVERLGGHADRTPSPGAQNDATAEEARAARDLKQRRDVALRLFLAAQPSLAGTPAESYLLARGINLARLGRQPRALRFHVGLMHPCGQIFPALIAAVTGADGAVSAVHRTFLARDGDRWGKAPVADPKLSLGVVTGGHIPLSRGASGRTLRDALPDERVVIGEGIETCLSIVMAVPELRVISAVSIGNMGSVVLPPQIRRVVLAADNDVKPDPRRRLARAILSHAEAGRRVDVARAPVGKDFNDTLRGFR